ncbi:hypothetical protein scyTo_0004321, partial [Scyliorhinus torazame]|nr:hypothetical protein [Scyliorhinus torazame]
SHRYGFGNGSGGTQGRFGGRARSSPRDGVPLLSLPHPPPRLASPPPLGKMATGGDPSFEERIEDQDLSNCAVNNGSLDDQLNNRDWSLQYKKANRSSEKNKKKLSAGSESRLTNDISPESSPGIGRRRAKTPKSYPPTKHTSHFSVPDSAELERLKQRINFSDLDERSIGSDSHGRATAANNQRPPVENRKPFNFLQQQINSNKSKDPDLNPQRRETKLPTSRMDLFGSKSKDSLPSDHASLGDDQGESEIESSQVVSRLIQIRDYISKAHSMRDDLMEKNERSANVERLSQLINHLKEQEKSYMKFLQKMLARENEEDEVGTTDSAVGSGSVADSTSLNLDVQSEASDATEDDQHRNAKEELENLKKQHELLKRMLEQQEQLRTLQGRQAALLALQHKAEQTIVGMDESVVTETTGSVSGLSITSELNEELNDLIQRFHNQLQNSQSVPDNRRQAESLSLTQEVSRSRDSSTSEHLSEQKVQLVNKLKVLQGKKERMDKLLDELHTLRDQHVNNSSISSSAPGASCSSHRSDQRSSVAAPTEADAATNREPSSLASSACILDSTPSQHENDTEENANPRKKLRKLEEVHKRLNELRELIDYYQQTSDMMTDAVNEHTKEDDDETEEESLYYSDQGNPEAVTNIRNPQRCNWTDISTASRVVALNETSSRSGRLLNTDCEINNRPTNLQTSNAPLPSDEPHISYVECSRYNDEKNEARNVDETQAHETQEDCASEGTVSSQRSSLVEEADQDFEIQQKINRLNAAKHKLRQLQELVAMVQEVPDSTGIDISNFPDFSLTEEDQHTQQPNNTRSSASRSSKKVALDEEKREKFYEAKLQQQQEELKQLQEERKRLMEIQEKIRHLQRSCPDLQLSTSSAGNLSKIKVPIVTSTPAICGQGATVEALPDPVAAPPPDSELWSEMRRHQILREELRQRRKQLEALMAEHQRQKTLTESNSINAASVKSEGTETQDTQQLSRTERTMATWGGSTQGALDDEEDDEDDEEEEENNADAGDDDEEENDYQSDGIAQSEVETSSHETYTVYPNQNRSQGTHNSRESKNRWKDKRTCSIDGNYRPFPKNKQQNVGMRRQENLRWAADLSYVEEREHWQEQVNQLTRQLEFSTNMCQTLMQDQQTFLTGPYSVMPSNVGSPQVHIIMHQLNQCYTQLAWQQNHVQRLKQMLNDLLHQQQKDKKTENHRDSSVPPPSPSNYVFPPFSFATPCLNPLSMSRLPNLSPFLHGFNLNPIFPPGFSDLSQNVSVQSNEQQPLVTEHSISGKTEYLAFPKPFESNSPKYRENKWTQKQTKDEREQSELMWQNYSKDEFGQSPRQMQPPTSLPQTSTNKAKQQAQCKNRKKFEESSLESFSSMPDPVDPTTITKTFKSRKACAQASLASKDKTPKGKCKKTYLHQKNHQEISAAHTGGAPLELNRNACSEAPVCGKTADHQARLDLQHEDAEYIESLENASMLSASSNLEPFANDDLGNTVIHLDKAMSRMREYERMKFEVENNQIVDVCTSAVKCAEVEYTSGNSCTIDHIADASDVTCPRIDTQQLDKQIKAIMTEVIPFLKEHMDDVCSPQLLTTIGCMVLALTQQNDESKEFVKFFHEQLGAILQDSLAKFAGRKLKECGEDLLVEISEILFNELAFFRLMQDLDNSSVAAKQRCKRLKEVASFKQRYTTEEKQHFKENGSSAEEIEDEDKDKDESETAIADDHKPNEPNEVELVMKGGLSDREEDDVDSEALPAECVSISLSKAETQALTNYGSGEDENEEDEIEDFAAGTIDVQTSLQANNEIADENDPEQDIHPETSKDDVVSQSMKTHLTVASAENESSPILHLPSESSQNTQFDAANEDTKSPKRSLSFCESANAGTEIELENDVEGTPESSLAGSPSTDSPVLVNDYQEAGSGNLSQKSDEDDFVKVENLPPSLSVLSEEELMRRISEEEQNNNLACVLLNADEDGVQELAGKSETLKEPENGGARSA